MKKTVKRIALLLATCTIFSTMQGCLFHKHTPIASEPIPPTCLADGLTGEEVCSECGEIVTAGTVVPALGHKEEIDAAVPSTCSKEGLTEGTHCATCGEILKAQESVEKLPHTYDSETEKLFTCTEDGVTRFTCSVCKDTYTEPLAKRAYSPAELFTYASPVVVEVRSYMGENAIREGSGFVIDPNGKIVTNYHVIDGADGVSVFIGEKEYKVRTVDSYDPEIDIAVLSINVKDLPVIPLCKKEHVTGSAVYAIGKPKGYSATFTNGIMTHADREIESVHYVQHNAAISAGSSGGPLINEYGEIIGINTFHIIDAQNMNFAIAISELDNLKNKTPMSVKAVFEKENDYIGKLQELLKDCVKEEFYTFIEEKQDSVNIEVGFYVGEDDTIHFMTVFALKNGTVIVCENTITPRGEMVEWVYADSMKDEAGGEFMPADFDASTYLKYSDLIAKGGSKNDVLTLVGIYFNLHMVLFSSTMASLGISTMSMGYPS